MLVWYRNQEYKRNHYMFCLLFCIIQVISCNIITEANNIKKDFVDENKKNKTVLEIVQTKYSLNPNVIKTDKLIDSNNLNSLKLKGKGNLY